MHIHHNPMTNGNLGIHSAGAAEKAAAAQRSSENRRKLLKSADQIDGSLDSRGAFMIGQWSEDSAGQNERHSHHPQQNKEQDEEVSEAKPISIWA